MCRLYGVTRSGFYAWRKRPKSARAQADEALLEDIRRLYAAYEGVYGSPRIHVELKAQGHRLGRKRVERLMRRDRLKARAATLYRANPGSHEFYHNIRNRRLDEAVTAPNQVWVADITYLKVAGQWRYLAAVMDLYSRRIIGWGLGKQRNQALTQRALDRAVQARRPKPGVIFHTDRGIEYGNYRFRARLAHHGLIQSMNRPKHNEDNNHMESFFGSLKAEKIHGRTFTDERELRGVVRDYIDGFYNVKRRHSGLDYQSPVAYEKMAA